MNLQTRNWFGSRLEFVPPVHEYFTRTLCPRYFQFLSPSIFFSLKVQFIGCLNDCRSNDYELISIFSLRAVCVTKRTNELYTYCALSSDIVFVIVWWVKLICFECYLDSTRTLCPRCFHTFRHFSVFFLEIQFIGCSNGCELISIFSFQAVCVTKRTNKRTLHILIL